MGKNKSRTLFATHYHELTEIENYNPKVRNVSCEIKEWKDEIIYSYKVTNGKSKGSLGIKVAELAGFPKDVTIQANALLRKFQTKKADSSSTVFEEDLVKEELLKLKGDLESIDLNAITPLDALNILYRLKNDI